MTTPPPIIVTMSFEKETRNKVRLQEMTVEGNAVQVTPKDKAVLEKLYVSKKAMKRLGEPGGLKVTLEAIAVGEKA